ncbi:MAG: T9SS type A sorting domain-containing protein [Ignavibacteriae bacterium]|nr:T9SS type A sorting domain-containing protein [Ignavibacteriota bacterium]MCB9243337.1 T9SS type A sorting domain-containing protein [Ignavibacteriales bacterium]
MKTAITLFFLFCSLSSYSQPLWMWQNPRPMALYKNDCVMLDNNTFIFIGSFGTIIRTSNSGNSWYQVEPVANKHLYHIRFVNPTTGFICCAGGILLKTTNSGTSWFSVPTNSIKALTSMFFINSSTGYIGGSGIIIKTTNSGVSFSTLVDTLSGYVSDIMFPEENIGYATMSSSYKIIKTTDAGVHWTPQLTGGVNAYQCYFSNAKNGMTLSQNNGYLLKTSNGGNNWLLHPIGTLGYQNDLKFVNQTTGFIASSSPNVIMKSTNTGENWFPFYTGFRILDFNWLNEQNGIGITPEGTGSSYWSIVRSTNGGVSWFENYEEIGNNYKINSIAYSDTNIGVAVCDTARILLTTNGIWNEIPSGVLFGFRLNEVKFINANTGFIIGNNATILKSTDKGITWENRFMGWSGNYTSIDFMNEKTGYIGNGNRIFKTTNSGENWGKIDMPISQAWTGIYFFDDNTGIVGGGEYILRTTNGGSNWTNIIFEPINPVLDIIFFDSMTGYALGGRNDRRTTNGGLNWVEIDSISNTSLVKVNDSTAVATDGHILKKTTNSGLNWFLFSDRVNNEVINDVEYLDNGQYVIAGNKGNILRTFTPGTVGINNSVENIPVKYFISQNYPNPFNPVTKIKYEVPHRSPIKIIIYDLTGREIRTLVNEFRDPGMYEAVFDGAGLSSGAYFYRIESPDFSQTRKMILLK